MRVPVILSILNQKRLDGAKEAAGEVEECGDELEGAADYDADEAEGQEDEPDQRVEEECGERKGPADYEKDEEEQKLEHWGVSLLRD
jgi:hypothetical protein